uniref:BTB domain-containing protein n=1 Tax=Zooxanthella nutricula TaxID=1333877 RepID=A0A6U6TVA8_9DINO|mmetsp:Transcript_81843/g.250075  ORF Transcript_81843/g.250075 Transcript_81843/m.250075 type:complete len:199 (+) Transcript_81843:131-727(+)
MSDACEDVTIQFDDGTKMMASSHVLSLASPVFRAMLASELREGLTKRVRISAEVGTQEAFHAFYKILLPGIGLLQPLTHSSIDSMVAMSHYYQVDAVKRVCEIWLLRQMNDDTADDVLIKRVCQAHVNRLDKLRERCINLIAERANIELSPLAKHPDLLLDVSNSIRYCLGLMRFHCKRRNSTALAPTDAKRLRRLLQ